MQVSAAYVSRCVFIMYDFELQRQSHVATRLTKRAFAKVLQLSPFGFGDEARVRCDAVGVKLRQDLRNRSKIDIVFYFLEALMNR